MCTPRKTADSRTGLNPKFHSSGPRTDSCGTSHSPLDLRSFLDAVYRSLGKVVFNHFPEPVLPEREKTVDYFTLKSKIKLKSVEAKKKEEIQANSNAFTVVESSTKGNKQPLTCYNCGKTGTYKKNVVKQTVIEDIKTDEVMIYMDEENSRISVAYNKVIDNHIEEEYVEIPDQKQNVKH
ncbi:hypothetical protein K0M31_012825 [Melipona bicolor]|uniref:Uncharacterized protein n=1 Tax=Melipona bicolor TaxID=60889 RepID=A0AA40FJ97_9HYME|nr:hypothetical protein K0M31_012825 [Melipona bicolor]